MPAKLCHGSRAAPTRVAAQQSATFVSRRIGMIGMRQRILLMLLPALLISLGAHAPGHVPGACAGAARRRCRGLPGCRARAAAGRGRQAGEGADLLFGDPARRHRRPGRRLRQALRRQGQGLARGFREPAAADHDGAQVQALRRRRGGGLELGARAAGAREPAAGSETRRISPTSFPRASRRTGNGWPSTSTPSCRPTTPIW